MRYDDLTVNALANYYGFDLSQSKNSSQNQQALVKMKKDYPIRERETENEHTERLLGKIFGE